MRLTPGLRLGPYEVLSVLGTGGMAEVYRARDTRLGREIAIKVVHESLASHPELLQRFEQEARLAGSLNHPNLVAVHDVGQHDGSPYLVTELLAGETLRRRLERGSIPLNTALEWAAQMAQGLGAAHARGIVHRDLKPDNVFLTTDGHVKLLDFGIAKLIEGVRGDGHHGLMDATETPTGHFTRTGSTFGTPGYMSPEQARGESLDARSDLFSLGAVIYEMLSGQRAFPGEPVDSSYAILHNEPRPLSSDLPPLVAQVVNHCLAKEPNRRFQSASDLAFDLDLLRNPSSTPVPGHARDTAGPAARWKGRWLTLGAALAVLLFAAVVARATRGRAPSVVAPSEVERVTFRAGTIGTGRFMPDGRVAFSAAFEGRPEELFIRPSGSPSAEALGIKNSHLAAVSRTGELAVLLQMRAMFGPLHGTLARLPTAGAVPKELAEDVLYADWSPGGDLAAVIVRRRECTLEYPLGNVLFRRTEGFVSHPRFSARGDRIAFLYHPYKFDSYGEVMVVDLHGTARTVGGRWPSVFGLAWAPQDSELWFTAGKRNQDTLVAMDLEGKTRELYRSVIPIELEDVSADGRALLLAAISRLDTAFVASDQSTPLHLSWTFYDSPVAISADGSVLLSTYADVPVSEEGLQHVIAVVQSMDRPGAKILGEFAPLDLSSDGQLALGSPFDDDPRLVVAPTGAGLPRRLEAHGLEPAGGARWLPDRKRIVLMAMTQDEAKPHLFLVTEGGSPPTKVTEAVVVGPIQVSPDGHLVATRDESRKPVVISLDDGTARAVPGLEGEPIPSGWGPDGSLWLEMQAFKPRAELVRVDVRTGRVLQKTTLAPADLTGVTYTSRVVVAPDGKGFAYSYRRDLGSLFILKDLTRPQ